MRSPPGARHLILLLHLFLLISPILAVPLTADDHMHMRVPWKPRAETHQYDVVIYGNTAAALTAAVQVKRMGKTVAVVFAGEHIGGLTSSGLGWTDSKNGNAIGGIAREFYGKVYAHYQKSGAWKQETRQNYLNRKIWSQPGPAIDDGRKVQWTFEPKVAEYVWETWMKDGKIPLYRNEAIVRSFSVAKNETELTAFTTQSGAVFEAKMFIDASYQGDLMEMAGVPYRIGRESREEYDESLAGVNIIDNKLLRGIDPYVKKGDPASGFISGVQRYVPDARTVAGKADPVRLQSFNYRVCLTKTPELRVPFAKPASYRESDYEILFRYIESGYNGPFFTSQLMPNIKTDSNAQGQVSTDLMGGNYDNYSNYAEWTYEERAAIDEVHKSWARGLFWTLAYHPRVPSGIRNNVSAWGLAKDEFVSNGNWPYEMYIRESRRMQGVYTVTQSDAQHTRSFPGDSVIGMGSYSLDVHQVERVVIDGQIYDEGLVHEANPVPFAIPYNSIIPEASAAVNLLNPVTMSGTHVAISAIRMEPTYMIMAQSAATAAVMAIEQGVRVQDVNRAELTARLLADKQVLSL